ncbi:MAG: hypothetical protein FH753_13075 [Firmicutes bacterium]|nr:hypothetical protein [Bacillota bacterium]
MYKSNRKLKRTLLGLSNLFTFDEARFIIDILEEAIPRIDMTIKEFLLEQIDINTHSHKADKKWCIDKENILDKINKANEDQCEEITEMAYEFWRNCRSVTDTKSMIKNIFLIK